MAELLGASVRPQVKRRARAEDAVCAHRALGESAMSWNHLCRRMRPCLAVDLRHHFLHVDALCDAIAMATVCRGGAVIVVQMRHDPGCRSLFPGVQMHEARDVATREVTSRSSSTRGSSTSFGRPRAASPLLKGNGSLLRFRSSLLLTRDLSFRPFHEPAFRRGMGHAGRNVDRPESRVVQRHADIFSLWSRLALPIQSGASRDGQLRRPYRS